MKLDIEPPSWEYRVALYGGHLVDTGAQSTTVKSYISAIKKMLRYDDHKLNMDEVIVNKLTKACKFG